MASKMRGNSSQIRIMDNDDNAIASDYILSWEMKSRLVGIRMYLLMQRMLHKICM